MINTGKGKKMVASLKVIAKDEIKIEFTAEEVAALEMPGISLGHLVVFRDKMEKLFKLEPLPTQYKDGFIDRIFEVHYAAKLVLHSLEYVDQEENLGKTPRQKEIWSWIWHILKDEFKVNNYVINITTGDISVDIDNAVGSESN